MYVYTPHFAEQNCVCTLYKDGDHGMGVVNWGGTKILPSLASSKSLSSPEIMTLCSSLSRSIVMTLFTVFSEFLAFPPTSSFSAYSSHRKPYTVK